ncbi:hypothetical protein HF1_05190 [Mycoplasma haemofelis str. Langford 1]|uniref:Uncharacterized protein n=1 Tax=Mycoplasma haemofelis (strain Langford 1) TaxID=941640 RepID=E8ZHA6_MYCHL|nr:hypothetical protein [Mycoplasma haemofelis]CBY92527.1 hypothetical protein HF1_05190 [Mycoplasma haemofelis str. Langford 1]
MTSKNLYLSGALGSAGALGGGMYLAYPSSSDPEPVTTTTASEIKVVTTIRERLQKDRYVLLTKDGSDSSHWGTILSKYQEAKNKPNNRLMFGTENVGIDTLQKDCESSVDSDDDELYLKVKLWCTVPKAVSERLEELGVVVLKTTGNDDSSGDKGRWVELAKKYKDSGNNAIDGLTLSGNDDNDWTKLRDKCNEYFTKDRWDEKYDYYLSKVSDWCSYKFPTPVSRA